MPHLVAKELEELVGSRPIDAHPAGCTSRLPRILRRLSARRVCTLGVLAILGSLAGGTSASADVETTPIAATAPTSASTASQDAASSARLEPADSPRSASSHTGDLAEGSQSGGIGPTADGDRTASSPRNPDEVVEELQTELTDPILMAVAPSPSYALSKQEGDAQYPLPYDGFLGSQGTKAVLSGGSVRTSQSKSAPSISGADPHWVNQLCASRVTIAYGSPNTRPQQGTALQRGCAHHKLLSQDSAPRRAGAPSEAGDEASSAAADDGEDDQPGSPVLRPVDATAGQLSTWYVPASGANSIAVRTAPDEPSFSPD